MICFAVDCSILKQLKEGKMPRQARLDIPGAMHHVTVRGNEHLKCFRLIKDRLDFVSRMGRVALKTDTRIYAWSLMENQANIILRSGDQGLPSFMRRLLTGFAVSYNQRHNRVGGLFQNRYQSVIFDEDTYFKKLVSHVHLLPLKQDVVNSISELDLYRWSGHAVIMGRFKNNWQDRDYVIAHFGESTLEGKNNYYEYVKKVSGRETEPDLSGGGLVRSYGGWSNIKMLRRTGRRPASDERILGSGDFVEDVLSSNTKRRGFEEPLDSRMKKAKELIEESCGENGITMNEILTGSRRRPVSEIRSRIALEMVEELNIPLTVTAENLGVSPSAVSKILKRASTEKMKIQRN